MRIERSVHDADHVLVMGWPHELASVEGQRQVAWWLALVGLYHVEMNRVAGTTVGVSGELQLRFVVAWPGVDFVVEQWDWVAGRIRGVDWDKVRVNDFLGDALSDVP